MVVGVVLVLVLVDHSTKLLVYPISRDCVPVPSRLCGAQTQHDTARSPHETSDPLVLKK